MISIKDSWRLIPLVCFVALFSLVWYHDTLYQSGLLTVDEMVPSQVPLGGVCLLVFSILMGQTLVEVVRRRKQQIILNAIVIVLCLGVWIGTVILEPAVLYAA